VQFLDYVGAQQGDASGQARLRSTATRTAPENILGKQGWVANFDLQIPYSLM
jgi:hypothetical protein